MCTKYWLMKNEPTEFSIDMLEEQGVGRWDGVRNFQARNFLRSMNEGDMALFYHSSCKEPGIYGSMRICKTAYPDPIALDKKSDYYDPKCSEDDNRWTSVDVQFMEKFKTPLLLPQIKELPLGQCRLTARGNRLSVFPLEEDQYNTLLRAIKLLNEEDES